MDRYAVSFSARFDRDIAEIEQDALGFGPAQVERYVSQLVSRCLALDLMPNRGTAFEVRGVEYRRFQHGGHVVFYRVHEEPRRVTIEAVLRGGRDFERHL